MSEILTMPRDEQAERAVLASMLLSPQKARELSGALTREHFHITRHRVLFQAAAELVAHDTPLDVITLSSHLRSCGQLDDVGGLQYVMSLFSVTPTAAHAEHYAAIVTDAYVRRQLVLLAEALSRAAQGSDVPTEELMARIEREVLDIGAGRIQWRPVLSLSEIVREVEQWIEHIHAGSGTGFGTLTRFSALDAALCGLEPGSLVVIGARPSMGKTCLATDITFQASTADAPGLFFSSEMNRRELVLRKVASLSGLSLKRIRGGRLEPSDWSALTLAQAQLDGMPVYIDDTPNIDVAELCAKTRRLCAKKRLGVVAIDYLQLLAGGKGDNRTQEIGSITRRLKQLAREIGAPVVLLSQLSRSCESREDKRPRLSDLRESGDIEQDADVVLFLYRDEVYSRNTEDRGIAEIIVAKQRNGPLSTVRLVFLASLTTFRNMATDDVPAGLDRYETERGGGE